jgi:hypothetical protein
MLCGILLRVAAVFGVIFAGLLLAPSRPATATTPPNLTHSLLGCTPKLGVGKPGLCIVTATASATTSWIGGLRVSIKPGSTNGRVVIGGGASSVSWPDVSGFILNSSQDGVNQYLDISCIGQCDVASGQQVFIAISVIGLVPGTVTIETTYGSMAPEISSNAIRVVGPDTAGVFRNGMWHLNNQNDSSAAEFNFAFGAVGDKAIVGDWDGDGYKTPGVFRNGVFYLSNKTDGSGPLTTQFFGAAGDIPVAGDWNGGGAETVGVFRNGMFFLTDTLGSGSPSVNYACAFGAAGD